MFAVHDLCTEQKLFHLFFRGIVGGRSQHGPDQTECNSSEDLLPMQLNRAHKTLHENDNVPAFRLRQYAQVQSSCRDLSEQIKFRDQGRSTSMGIGHSGRRVGMILSPRRNCRMTEYVFWRASEYASTPSFWMSATQYSGTPVSA